MHIPFNTWLPYGGSGHHNRQLAYLVSVESDVAIFVVNSEIASLRSEPYPIFCSSVRSATNSELDRLINILRRYDDHTGLDYLVNLRGKYADLLVGKPVSAESLEMNVSVDMIVQFRNEDDRTAINENKTCHFIAEHFLPNGECFHEIDWIASELGNLYSGCGPDGVRLVAATPRCSSDVLPFFQAYTHDALSSVKTVEGFRSDLKLAQDAWLSPKMCLINAILSDHRIVIPKNVLRCTATEPCNLDFLRREVQIRADFNRNNDSEVRTGLLIFQFTVNGTLESISLVEAFRPYLAPIPCAW